LAPESSDLVIEERALEAEWARSESAQRGFRPHAAMLMRYAAEGGSEALPARVESRLRFWVERPDRWREEWASSSLYGRDDGLDVRDGEHWWTYHPGRGASSGIDSPWNYTLGGTWMERLTDPAGLLAGFELVVEGHSEQAGRPALVVCATPRLPPSPTHVGGGLGAMDRGGGGDEYRVLVDRERLRRRYTISALLALLTSSVPRETTRFVAAKLTVTGN
jgi:hypothetical protein